MLTPVEEAGLAGAGLAARVRRALHQVPEAELAGLIDEIARQARARHLVYVRDGVEETLRLLAMPIAALPDQLAYVRGVVAILHGALLRLPDLYFADPDVRAILALPEAEERWLRRYWTPQAREQNTVIGRHDAVIDFASSDWKDTLQFLEPNLGGIGGLHMVPTAARIIGDVLLPALHARDPDLHLEQAQDIRDLLVQELLDHAEAAGRRGRTICFLEPKYAGQGPDEQSELARYIHEHFGLEVFHADPAELALDGDEVTYEGRVIDMAYRDYAVEDLLELAAEGVDVRPMEALFAQNRMVSTIGAELDQKSCWHVLGDPVLAARHFSAEERRVFRRHVPWTRLVRPGRESLPDGREGELLEHVLAEREQLVLKPNRAYGGEGVTLGMATTAAEWQGLVETAVAERWVVQRKVALPVHEFPLLDAERRIHAEPFYVVYGFAPSRYGLATLGRASQKQVVNVSQRGGLCSVVVGHPPGRLVL